jgi:hypothetical protein
MRSPRIYYNCINGKKWMRKVNLVSRAMVTMMPVPVSDLTGENE